LRRRLRRDGSAALEEEVTEPLQKQTHIKRERERERYTVQCVTVGEVIVDVSGLTRTAAGV